MFEDLIIRIAHALEANGLSYMIIGGQAVLLYGTARMTKDIDIALGVDVDELDRTVQAVEDMGLQIIPEDFRSFVLKTYVLPTRDGESGIRVDFIFSYSSYERQAIKKASPVSLRGTQAMFASVEDLIIHKIFAGRPRDLEDVRSVILKNPGFNREYTRKWLKEFDRSMETGGFTRLFDEVLQSAG